MSEARRQVIVALLCLGGACARQTTGTQSGSFTVDAARMMADVEFLAHDSLQGRSSGSEGARIAGEYIAEALQEAGLQSFGDSYFAPFAFTGTDSAQHVGVNVVGYIDGSGSSEHAIVLTAHYDHLGVRNGQVYNGADDNASGTAALLAIARHVAANPLQHTVIFAAVDAEEMGLQGARAFVREPPLPASRIGLNVNLDMVSHSDSLLFVAGTYHYPFLKSYLESVQPHSPVVLRLGHDSPDLPSGDDWTLSSDHAPFHQAGIPFVYFGVEDHPNYHQPTDDAPTINPVFFAGSASTIFNVLTTLDANLDEIVAQRAAP